MVDCPPVELIPVPTVAQLVTRGLAKDPTVDKRGRVTSARMTAEGHRVMGEALLENGRRLREYDQSRKVSRETMPQQAADQRLPPDDPWFDLGPHAIDK